MAGCRELWPLGFLGAPKAKKELEYFLKLKQWSKLSSQGQHYSSSPYRQRHWIWLAVLCPDPSISLLWGAVTLLSSPELVFTPLTFGGRTGGGAAGLVIWGLPGRRKILVLNKLDLQPSLGSGCAWDETRGNRSLTGNVRFWNRRLAPERWRCLIWGFVFHGVFFFVIVRKVISYPLRQTKWQPEIKKKKCGSFGNYPENT